MPGFSLRKRHIYAFVCCYFRLLADPEELAYVASPRRLGLDRQSRTRKTAHYQGGSTFTVLNARKIGEGHGRSTEIAEQCSGRACSLARWYQKGLVIICGYMLAPRQTGSVEAAPPVRGMYFSVAVMNASLSTCCSYTCDD